MRIVAQRVCNADVSVAGTVVGAIDNGLLLFVGIGRGDSAADAAWLAAKLPRIRCFEDTQQRMNRNISDVAGGFLVISQFTLFGDLRKGTRPSFNDAAPPAQARELYLHFVELLRQQHCGPVACGEFGAMMTIRAVHDGPVTLLLDTHDKGRSAEPTHQHE